MYCSHCGNKLSAEQTLCPRCGQSAVPLASPPPPGFDAPLAAHAGKVHTLALLWFAYAALSLAGGLLSLHFARLLVLGPFGPWFRGGDPTPWYLPALLHFAWITILVRSALAAVAGWGLWERTGWGRIVAIVAAFLSLFKFPIGTALGIWTLIVLLGDRNAMLYESGRP